MRERRRRHRSVAFALLSAIVLCLASTAMAVDHLVAFSAKDANYNDEFAFVALTNIPNGTVIFFTNYDWDNTVGIFPTTAADEGTLQFTSTAVIPIGTVVHVVETSANTYTVTGSGTAVHVSGTWAAVSADPHYAFAASNPAAPLTTATEIYAYMDTDPDTAGGGVKDPRIGFNASPNAVVLDFIGVQPVGTDFIRDRSTAGLGNLTNPVNFSTTSGTGDVIVDLTPFTGIANGAIFADGFESGNTAGW